MLRLDFFNNADDDSSFFFRRSCLAEGRRENTRSDTSWVPVVPSGEIRRRWAGNAPVTCHRDAAAAAFGRRQREEDRCYEGQPGERKIPRSSSRQEDHFKLFAADAFRFFPGSRWFIQSSIYFWIEQEFAMPVMTQLSRHGETAKTFPFTGSGAQVVLVPHPPHLASHLILSRCVTSLRNQTSRAKSIDGVGFSFRWMARNVSAL